MQLHPTVAREQRGGLMKVEIVYTIGRAAAEQVEEWRSVTRQIYCGPTFMMEMGDHTDVHFMAKLDSVEQLQTLVNKVGGVIITPLERTTIAGSCLLIEIPDVQERSRLIPQSKAS